MGVWSTVREGKVLDCGDGLFFLEIILCRTFWYFCLSVVFLRFDCSVFGMVEQVCSMYSYFSCYMFCPGWLLEGTSISKRRRGNL